MATENPTTTRTTKKLPPGIYRRTDSNGTVRYQVKVRLKGSAPTHEHISGGRYAANLRISSPPSCRKRNRRLSRRAKERPMGSLPDAGQYSCATCPTSGGKRRGNQSKRNRKGRLIRCSMSCGSSHGPVRVLRIKPIAACTPNVKNNSASSLEKRARVLIRCARRMR